MAISSGDFIRIGEVLAIVVTVRSPEAAEVVYLNRDRAVGEEAVFAGGRWTFERPDPCGTYADTSDRLQPFAHALRGRLREMGRHPR